MAPTISVINRVTNTGTTTLSARQQASIHAELQTFVVLVLLCQRNTTKCNVLQLQFIISANTPATTISAIRQFSIYFLLFNNHNRF